MGHSEEDCYLKKISNEKEKKTRSVYRGLRRDQTKEKRPLKINSLPGNAKCRKLPIIGIFFKGVYIDALIDSGSEATLMSDRVWEKKLETKGIEQGLVGVDGTELEIVGKGEEEIQMGKKQVIKHSYYVVRNMPYDIIFGKDFLEKNKAIIDLGECKVIINGETITYNRGQYVNLIRQEGK